MKILTPNEVDTNRSINRTIRSGQLGVIVNEDNDFELVYFVHCHYLGSGGRISNTFGYKSFNDDGVVEDKEKSYLYGNIYNLSEDAKSRYTTRIQLVRT